LSHLKERKSILTMEREKEGREKSPGGSRHQVPWKKTDYSKMGILKPLLKSRGRE